MFIWVVYSCGPSPRPRSRARIVAGESGCNRIVRGERFERITGSLIILACGVRFQRERAKVNHVRSDLDLSYPNQILPIPVNALVLRTRRPRGFACVSLIHTTRRSQVVSLVVQSVVVTVVGLWPACDHFVHAN